MRGRIGLAGSILLGVWGLVQPAGGEEPARPMPTLTLRSGAGRVRSVALSADGKLLATGTDDYRVRLWDVAGGREIRSFIGMNPVIFSKDGKWLVTGDSSARVWDLATGKELRAFPGPGFRAASTCVALSDDGKRLIFDKLLLDPGTGEKVHDLPHGGWDDAAAFSADGKVVASVGGGFIHLWSIATGQEIRVIRSPQIHVLTAVALSRDGKLVVTNDDKLARLWDATTGKEIRTFPGHASKVTSVILSADDKLLATAGGEDGTVRLWEVATAKEVRSFKGPAGNVYGALGPQTPSVCAAMTPDARWLAVGSTDGTTRLWDVATGKEVRAFRGSESAVALAATPDGKWLVVGDRKSLHLWDL